MSAITLADYVADLERSARSASVVEEDLRREFTRRFADLERERQFAFRRFHLMRSVTQAVTGAKDEADALARGAAAFMGEIGWSGASEQQRAVTERFRPVVLAAWSAAHPAEGGAADAGAVKSALAAFESWYAEANNNAPFLTLLEQPLEYYPLVEG